MHNTLCGRVRTTALRVEPPGDLGALPVGFLPAPGTTLRATGFLGDPSDLPLPFDADELAERGLPGCEPARGRAACAPGFRVPAAGWPALRGARGPPPTTTFCGGGFAGLPPPFFTSTVLVNWDGRRRGASAGAVWGHPRRT